MLLAVLWNRNYFLRFRTFEKLGLRFRSQLLTTLLLAGFDLVVELLVACPGDVQRQLHYQPVPALQKPKDKVRPPTEWKCY
jgi:hypothetical protein